MTVRELARLANVSPSTVSKAFSGATDIGEKTREKIFSLAKENGCFTKFYKDNFGKKVYGIICPELNGQYYIKYVIELQKIIAENGGIAIISSNNFDKSAQCELIDYFGGYAQVDGLFIIGQKEPLKRGYSIPVVAMLTSFNLAFDAINIDNDSPLYEAVEDLHGMGHKKIAFIGEELTKSKKLVFCKAAKIPFDDELAFTSKYRFQKAGEDGVRQILKKCPDCTAFVCAYDEIALGAIIQLQKMGYNVPLDFSVIGANNTDFSQYAVTPISTIGENIEEICRLAWEQMSKKQGNKYYRNKDHIRLKSEFLPRETVAPPRNS